MKKVFIDGKAGTTGLRIYERLADRDDVTLILLSDEERKDAAARKRALNECDIAFLCLPDDAAREAVSMVDNPDVVIIDASTAHRTADGWSYGFPELSADAKLHGIEIFTAYQSFDSIPKFYSIPKDRIKPFGTVHAVLSAKDIINEPFAIINADDFYGRDAFCVMSKALDDISDNCGAMVAYKLKNTVSKNGSVTRGVCKTEFGMLTDIIETQNISLLESGDIIDEATGKLDPDLSVSMNMWGFTPYILKMMENSFNEFLKELESDDIKSEYPIPSFVGKRITDGELSIKVFTTVSEWFGVTYIEDRPFVKEQLHKFKEDEIYPANLKL